MIEKLKYYKEHKQRVRLLRTVWDNNVETTNGYILELSHHFVLIHESDDFKIDGYVIVPLSHIKKIRFNKSDKYFNKMMEWEKEADKVGINYAIDLTDWQSIFKSLKVRAGNIIIECEGADINPFNIGPIEKAGRKKVQILYFDAEGYFESAPTTIDYDDITKIRFDTQYINVFSKYTRYKKTKTINK